MQCLSQRQLPAAPKIWRGGAAIATKGRSADLPLQAFFRLLGLASSMFHMSPITGRRDKAFDRKLPFIETLRTDPPQWWVSLLSMWRPSGMPSEGFGLRLAVRNGYLNLYRQGQSVALVQAGPHGLPIWQLHETYTGKKEGKGYVTVGRDVPYPTTTADFHRWICDAAGKSGREKRAVDDLVGRDENVIDLEMGLPGHKPAAEGNQRRSAFRIDMVAVEAESATVSRLKFWEVKTFDDRRIRSSSDLPTSTGILKQIEDYQAYLADAERRAGVLAAYKRCAVVLQSLRNLANEHGDPMHLGQELLNVAAGKPLVLADKPGLLVVLPTEDLPIRSKEAWEEHERKLKDAGIVPRIERSSALNNISTP